MSRSITHRLEQLCCSTFDHEDDMIIGVISVSCTLRIVKFGRSENRVAVAC
jgi:hypothetical protein